ncbi:hypothetical protein EDC01DRAFT_791226 [Geopyxis carbonaria]|nr:hypothetical protein EDC01DRAFT_791226 [Geopyxis carbonaria]
MAPQPPRALTTTIRTTRRSPTPSIYAISHGPQRGVHLLSADPLPAELQYLYRHPINVHRTFLTVSGDFLRRRFDSIDAAVRWIDERDREAEIVEALAGASLDGGGGGGVQARSRMEEEAGAGKEETAEERLWGGAARRQRRASDPVYRFAPRSMAESGTGAAVGGGGIRKAGSPGAKKTVWRGRYGTSHLGVRRRELLYSLVCDDDEEKGKEVEKERGSEAVAQAVAEMFEKEEPQPPPVGFMGGMGGMGGEMEVEEEL